jgi:phosphonate transport system ATP-binding protein
VQLRLEDVWFSYRNPVDVLRGVNIAFSSGEVTMVLGRSGSGKTTLLKVAAGLLKPKRGRVVAVDDSGVELSDPRIGYIPQGIGVVGNMSVLENVLLGAFDRSPKAWALLGRFPREEVERAEEVLELLGLGDVVWKRARELSGGQKQRVAIARSLMHGSELVLADEFVSQLDPLTAIEVLELVRRLRSRGVGFAITTHDVHLVPRYADRVAVLREGRIVLEGEARSIAPEDLVRAL